MTRTLKRLLVLAIVAVAIVAGARPVKSEEHYGDWASEGCDWWTADRASNKRRIAGERAAAWYNGYLHVVRNYAAVSPPLLFGARTATDFVKVVDAWCALHPDKGIWNLLFQAEEANRGPPQPLRAIQPGLPWYCALPSFDEKGMCSPHN
jgi:hypothetical protein